MAGTEILKAKVTEPSPRAMEGEILTTGPPGQTELVPGYSFLMQRTQSEFTHLNFQMFKPILEKAEEPEIKLPTSAGSWKKQESFRKTSISALLTMPKPLCGSQETMENSERDGNTRPHDLPLEKPICRSGSNS